MSEGLKPYRWHRLLVEGAGQGSYKRARDLNLRNGPLLRFKGGEHLVENRRVGHLLCLHLTKNAGDVGERRAKLREFALHRLVFGILGRDPPSTSSEALVAAGKCGSLDPNIASEVAADFSVALVAL